MARRVCMGMCVLVLLGVTVYAQSQDGEEQAQQLQTENTQRIDETLLPIEDEQGAFDPGEERSRAIGFGDVVRMLLVLGAVIAIIYITFALLRKASRSQVQSSAIIQNISTVPLGGNRALHVVRIGARHYLIGSGEQSVQLIEAIEDAETIEYINQHKHESSAVAGGTFKSRIRSLLNAVQKPASAPTSASALHRISRNHRRLKGM